jgi:TIR domain-containing protein
MTSNRNWLLISHANPEDNSAALWFSTQLANEGYLVWTDIIKLVGGEDFWGDIEEVIRTKAAKVVFLLSTSANTKEGCQKELHLAQALAKKEQLRDFVIPLRIDDIAHGDVGIRVNMLNIIESQRWNDGLAQLLKKLDSDGVPRGPAKDFRATNEWWKARFQTSRAIGTTRTAFASNWFRAQAQTLELHWHQLRSKEIGPLIARNLPWPSLEGPGGIWTFAPANSVNRHLQNSLYVDRTKTFRLEPASMEREHRDIAYQLLMQSLHSLLLGRGLLPRALAEGRTAFAFPKDLVPDNEIKFESLTKKRRRSVVGYKTRINGKGESWLRYWHYAIQPIPAFHSEFVLILKAHVFFSSDGKTLWASADRQHKARRNQCRNWWNDAWRDRMLAAASWLANGQGAIPLDIGSPEPLMIDAVPIQFDADFDYVDPDKPDAIDSDANDDSATASEGVGDRDDDTEMDVDVGDEDDVDEDSHDNDEDMEL